MTLACDIMTHYDRLYNLVWQCSDSCQSTESDEVLLVSVISCRMTAASCHSLTTSTWFLRTYK